MGEGCVIFGEGWDLLGCMGDRWAVYPRVSQLIPGEIDGVVWQAACLLLGCGMLFVHSCCV